MRTAYEKAAMSRIESTRFGTVDIDQDSLLDIPKGLIGLDGTRYALITPDEDSAFSWLQSCDEPGLALPVTRPWEFFPDYEVVLSDEETDRIGVLQDATADVWVTVRATADPQACSVNLKAPILVYEGRAHQVINEAPDVAVRTPLFPAGPAAPSA